MKNRPSKAARATRQVPLDHLRPGGQAGTEPDTQASGPGPAAPAEPPEPAQPGAGNADATRGKATSSPAAVATRPHLEGSEQGPS